jgi:glycosyltransferase involved in cell wall biosynthesis
VSGRPEIRVLHLINGLGTGGAERSLAQMLPLLADRGVMSTVVCLFRRKEGVQNEVIANGWDVRFLPGGSWPRRASALRRTITEIEPHLLHNTLFESDLLGRLATVGTGVPIVTSLVNVSYEPVRMGDPNVRRYKLRTLQLVDALTGRLRNRGWHAISQAVADSNMRRLRIPAEKITVIPRSRPAVSSPVGPGSEVRERTRRKLGIAVEADVVLAVGRHEYQKGHVHLVDAFSGIAESRQNAWLLIAGREGNATPHLRKAIARATGSERILVLGHRSDINELLQTADIFAFPSLYEGLGGSLLEAMAAGLAIVASDLPAIRELAGDAILYASPGDHADISKQLKRLMADSELRAKLGRAARRRFDTWPNPDQVADQMAEWYRRVVSDRLRAGRESGQRNEE